MRFVNACFYQQRCDAKWKTDLKYDHVNRELLNMGNIRDVCTDYSSAEEKDVVGTGNLTQSDDP